MIYFTQNRKDKGKAFIDINIPSNASQIQEYFETRKAIFCDEQKLFLGSDVDEYDDQAIPIIALNHYLGVPDQVVGVVRIYQTKQGEWFGGRLGVLPSYRAFSKFTCPNLFKDKKQLSLCEMSIAAGLIYRAVSLANYIGCHHFYAYVQPQNVKLFKRLHWNVVGEKMIHGIKHSYMEANLKSYPATPIYLAANENISRISQQFHVA